MNFGGRLRFEREARGLTQEEVCERAAALGHRVTQQDITSLERRDSKRSQHAPAICEAIGLDLTYMLTGVRPKSDGAEDAAPHPSEKYEFAIRVHGVVLSAGNGSTHWEHEEIDGSHAFTRAWLQRKRLKIENCRMLTVDGDSMLPELRDGFIVLIDLSDCSPIKTGKVYALSVEGEQRIKRLFPQVDGSLLLSSDNPDKKHYPDEYVKPEHLDRVRIIGRKRWHGGDDD